jgi:hypothetical protein
VKEKRHGEDDLLDDTKSGVGAALKPSSERGNKYKPMPMLDKITKT